MHRITGAMLDHDLIEGPHDRAINETGDLDRVIDHDHCSSILECDRLCVY